jgi:hypothetical protein
MDAAVDEDEFIGLALGGLRRRSLAARLRFRGGTAQRRTNGCSHASAEHLPA